MSATLCQTDVRQKSRLSFMVEWFHCFVHPPATRPMPFVVLILAPVIGVPALLYVAWLVHCGLGRVCVARVQGFSQTVGLGIRFTTAYLLIGASAVALRGQNSKGGVESAKGSIFDEYRIKMPDYSELPAREREEARRKWKEENIGSGVPKFYVRFMERLLREAKPPAKDSRYIGDWGRQGKSELVLSADGSFTFDYGHTKGVGIWREHREGIIWIGFECIAEYEDGKKVKSYSEHWCYLAKDGSLVQDHLDYTETYVRQKPRAGSQGKQ